MAQYLHFVDHGGAQGTQFEYARLRFVLTIGISFEASAGACKRQVAIPVT